MMTMTSEAHSWSRARWATAIVIVLIVQVACIFFLSNRSPILARTTVTAPILHLMANGSDELLTLRDPTLFALPHQEGFSGEAWLRMPPLVFHPFKWSEPLHWLPLPTNELGAFFTTLARSETVTPIQFEAKPGPKITSPDVSLTPLTATPSTLRITGELSGRRLLTPFDLPPQPNSDVLTSSVVQVLVDASGNVLSATLLPPGSGSDSANKDALNFAKSARFEPLNHGGPGTSADLPLSLTLGEMIFQWQTVALPATNALPRTAIP